MVFRNGDLQYKSIFLIIFLFIAVITSESCKTVKKIQAAISRKDSTSKHITNQSSIDSVLMIRKTMNGIKNKEIKFKTFSAKIKVEYEDSKGKQPNITAYVRIFNDSIIWISGYATVFNIEAFRVLVTKDSVFVIDKINREVKLRSMDYLQEISEIPFDLKTLQNLLVGNPVFFNDSVVTYKETGSKVLVATIGQFFKNLLTLNKENQLLVHSKLDDLDITRNRTADITYSDFDNSTGIPFSTYREITVSEKNKLDIRLNFKQFEFNKDVQISFNIPKNYKRN